METEILEKIPEEITVCMLECVVMPNGEVISMSKTLGRFEDFETKLFEIKKNQ